ncbi:hypothetical protein FQN54_007089 [Arachnomyces sp. PD_36]|nr:hypothetical protein FQN54_007089 [Arachnomyces sp. PD_36]
MENATQVYLLPLRDDGSPDIPGGYIYLPPPSDPPYTLRFIIEGTSSICRNGSLWVNIPPQGQQFDRNKFQQFKPYGLHPDFNRAIQIEIPITVAGAFAFYTTFTPLPDFSVSPSNAAPEPTRTETHYVDVSPRLTLRGEDLPQDAISLFSVISKFLGKYPDDWDSHLRGISERGYNMVHFTPLTKRGASNSPYSIYDQLEFDPTSFPNGEQDVADMVVKMENEYGLLGLTDVVWNHTAHNSKWLEAHPEAGYNVETAPWLEAALDLDDALLKYGEDLESLGLPTDFKTTEDLLTVMTGMRTHVIDRIKLWEYYVVDVERDTKESLKAYHEGKTCFPEGGFGDVGIGGLDQIKEWSLERRAEFLRKKALSNTSHVLGRYSRKIDPEIGAALLTALFGRYDRKSSGNPGIEHAFLAILKAVNVPLYDEYDADVTEILEQVYNRVKYVRLDDHGPKTGPVTKENPLIEPYFTRLPVNETTKTHNPRALALVNNGWIWNADVMKDNAGPESRAYLRREVIVWGDCVKLRYGSSPADNPYLWDLMGSYTRLMAKYFAGFRIDNCHSTPLAVAEHMLCEARKVRPNLVVFAELFTGSEESDYVFVKRLGLSALIREAMQAWSTGELSRLVHRHGGRPIGSFDLDLPPAVNKTVSSKGSEQRNEITHHIRQSPVHALFMDCTHDNEVPAQKRDARDTLPNAALVYMCASSIGSVMGYDEIYPRLIDLVNETRLYASTPSIEDGGIGGVKKLLNKLHTTMGNDGYNETHIHHEGEYITVHRVHAESRKGVFLVAHTAFPGQDGSSRISPVNLTGTKVKLIGSWALEVDASDETKKVVVADKDLLKGLPSKVRELSGIGIQENGHDTTVTVPEDFPPGSIALLETWIPDNEHSQNLAKFVTEGADVAFQELDLIDLNSVLYRCDAEERDSSDGKDGVYVIPKHGALVYAGLQGWWSVLENIVKYNELGHPLCDHLRDGQWALDYIVGRMEKLSEREGYTRLKKPTTWLREKFDSVRKVPSFLLPKYFATIIRVAYDAAWRRGIQLFPQNIQQGDEFIQKLAMVSVQQTGFVKSASLYPTKNVPSLAAGLPHFSTDWARCWGRDVFISLRGLLLCTGRFDEAKEHIIAFGSVLKHGMIPNLLSRGKLPRYNSRDSVWFFLQAIQDYVDIAPNGINILKEEVPRRFLPYDDTWFPFDDPRAYSKSSTIAEIIQEVFQRHASGLSFREYNAGPDLDVQMKSEGFQIDVNVDWETGIIFGGSQWNCGTWMDKMGESEKAGSKGFPGTPRDGAAIEITGLAYSALQWVSKLHQEGKYSHDGVRVQPDDTVISFKDWAARIKKNFERCYYIPENSSEDGKYDLDSSIVNRRGIYKDLYKSGKPYEDYQLRPNFTIAMTVAPDLFTPSQALKAISHADTVLCGPTGMATLDPSDLNYHPNYNNGEDSTDFATSKGRNYHQGPEWVWPRGYFLRAWLQFDLPRRKTAHERTEMFQLITKRLEGCKRAIGESDWRGLTELTNKDGSYCADSSPTQAWSAGCLLDLYFDASQVQLDG